MTDRAWAELIWIERFQPVSTRHIAERFDLSLCIARRDLRRLRDFKFVHVHLPLGMEGDNRFSLSVEGRQALVNRQTEEPAPCV